jgi:hypothetical protein
MARTKLDRDVEVPVAVEGAGVDELRAGKGALRDLVGRPHVRAGRRAVEDVVALLDALAVVALAVRQSEEPFLEDRVAPVPEGEREAEPALPVGEAEQPASPQRYARRRAASCETWFQQSPSAE